VSPFFQADGELEVRVRRLPHNPDLPLPERATPGSAGFDLRTAEPDFVFPPGEIRSIRTGLELELPPGVEAQVRPRSGLALRHGLIIPNSPGTIDSDFRGEVQVLLMNLGSESVSIRRGDRIAQLVFARYVAPQITERDSLSETERGAGGFGSTGRG